MPSGLKIVHTPLMRPVKMLITTYKLYYQYRQDQVMRVCKLSKCVSSLLSTRNMS